MQRRILLNFWVITVIILFGFMPKVFADTASTTELINVEILSNVWYSTTTINENDNINIYAGFQNHSTKNLSGTAGFFVDDLQISKMDFIAGPKSLIKLETKYVAVRGSHTAQVKIIDIAEIDGSSADKLYIENLLAKESEKNNFSVKYEITKEEVIKNVADTANSVVKTIDTQAEKLATYVESLKQPGYASSSGLNSILSQISPSQIIGKVLGTSTENISNAKNNGQTNPTTKSFSFYNMFLDALAFVIRHWVWSLIIIVAGVLYISFR